MPACYRKTKYKGKYFNRENESRTPIGRSKTIMYWEEGRQVIWRVVNRGCRRESTQIRFYVFFLLVLHIIVRAGFTSKAALAHNDSYGVRLPPQIFFTSALLSLIRVCVCPSAKTNLSCVHTCYLWYKSRNVKHLSLCFCVITT